VAWSPIVTASGEAGGLVSGAQNRRVFLAHAAEDKAAIQRLRQALADRGIGAWEDVLELRLGAKLDGIQDAIVGADGFVLLLTPESIGSDWVQREVGWARETKLLLPEYALLPILRGLQRPALKLLFGEAEMVSIVLEPSDAIESAVGAIAQALGLAAQDATPRPDPLPAPAMAELSIELEEPRMLEEAGPRRAAAKARVRYVPAGGGRGVDGRTADFTAPLGPIEAGELRWYLEEYGDWPFGVFKERAKAIEASLPAWGRKLFDAMLGRPEGRAAFEAWRDAGKVARRITLQVDDRGGDEEGRPVRLEAAAVLFALPWELLADDGGYLFEGNLKARVRRMLPSERALEPAEPRLPLRVLLVLARPEDKHAVFIDPRVSAVPLAEALDPLGEAVELTVLADGTVKALREELDAAEREGKPYQVVHFDGHGVYDKLRGLGQLCFENADDAAKGKLERAADLVDAAEIGAMLRERRVALFVLEACESAMTEKNPTASVAAELLKAGVASVVAMSHAVLVETARRFVGAFYGALAEGERVGAAMVRAQHALKDDRARGEIRATTFELSDWMVPVLFQEDADARLFPDGVDLRPATVEDRKRKAKVRRGELPEPPKHGFVGRAKVLLAIDRRLHTQPYLALTGGGGQGKTALAVEAARWLLAMRRVERVAFVSVEQISEARAVLDAIGRQLVPGYAVATAEGNGSEAEKRRRARLPVEQLLMHRKVLLVVDNLESVLPKAGEPLDPGAVELLGMIQELGKVGTTRVILTSREALPAPFEGKELPLPALGRREGMELLAGVLRHKRQEPPKAEEDKEAVETLVEAVGGHARSLVLLGELVAERGVQAVAEDVRGMMAELEARYPDQRERSLIASVRLSLRKLPVEVREKIRGLSVFHGAAHVAVMAHVLQVEPQEALELGRKLVAVGLADADGPYLLPDPGLGVSLSGALTEEEREAAERRWIDATVGLVRFLYEQGHQDAKVARHGTQVALADLLAALTTLERDVSTSRAESAEAIEYVTNLEELVSHLGLPRVLARIAGARRALLERLPAWSHARFSAESAEVDRRLEAGDVAEAVYAARGLRDRTEAAGDAYPEAAYDRATSWWRLGRILGHGGRSDEALPVLEEARERFSKLAVAGTRDAAWMEAAVMTDRGDALRDLGRLDEAAAAYEDGVQRAKALGDLRSVAVGNTQLGTVGYFQGRFKEAVDAYQAARATFEALGEPRMVAVVWHQLGMVHAAAENFDAAEHAYKRSLALKAANGNRRGEAATLHQLASLYDAQGRLEDAAALYRQTIDLHHTLGNRLDESTSLNNVGAVLRKLRCFDEARDALTAFLDIIKPYGHAAEPWKTWTALERVERDAGRPDAGREARREALRTYRAYRADGGEPMEGATRLIAAFGQALRESGPDAARALLPDPTQVPDVFAPTLRALHAISAGSRDPALADDPALYSTNAVELALLLESLPPAAG
jgi:tetratricopeptide (TPR) repeat protein